MLKKLSCDTKNLHLLKFHCNETMSPILKKGQKSILKRRNVPHLSVKIETVQENKVSFDRGFDRGFDKTNLLETRNESFFESVWPGKINTVADEQKNTAEIFIFFFPMNQ